jgi:outer membrane protein assembly complex protein YaeT
MTVIARCARHTAAIPLLTLGFLLGTPTLSAAEFRVQGLNWIGDHQAEQRLRVLLGDRAGANLDASTIEDASLVLFSSLADEGYLAPVVRADISLTDGTRVDYPLDARLEHPLPRPLTATTAVFHVERGRRFAIRELAFEGLRAIAEKNARAFFVGEEPLIPLASERIYSPDRLQRSLSNLEESLRQLGYADAQVTAGAVEIDRTTGRVRVQVLVQEGRRWIVDKVQLVTTDASAAPEKIEVSHLGAPWNPTWRQDTTTAIRRWYYSRGYPDVQIGLTVTTALQPDGTNGVSVVARITPGPLVHVGAVRFEGNQYTHDNTLRRLVKSGPGDALNPVKFDNAQARISRLGVFRAVDLRYDPPAADTRDVVYDLTEGRRQEVSLLAGYGSYEQLRGGVEWEHYNLFGLAHSSSLKFIESIKSTEGDYTYTVPELFGSSLDGSARLFGLRREEPSFNHEEYGANVSVLWPLRSLGLSLTTGYTFKHVLDSNDELATQTTDQPSTDVGAIDIGLVRDRRDNPLQPRKGYKLSLQAEFASRDLGGEVVYQQLVFAASYHTNWGDTRWIHLGISQGVILTLGSADSVSIPVSVLFFPGGEGSIRGYRRGEAAPRAPDGQFVGAKTYTLANAELEQALTKNLSVVAFGDALGDSARLEDYPATEELYSVGLGLRYQTIIGPVRLEYGHNLNPRPDDPAGTLLISIGFPF